MVHSSYKVRTVACHMTITEWHEQRYDRGLVYIAEDLRGVYQFFSHTMRGLQFAIQETTNQRVSMSSLYEAKLGQLKKERTASTFRVLCMRCADAIEYLNTTRTVYDQRIVALIAQGSLRTIETTD